MVHSSWASEKSGDTGHSIKGVLLRWETSSLDTLNRMGQERGNEWPQ